MRGPEYELVTRHEDLGRVANEIAAASEIQLDLETTDLDPLLGEVRILSVNTGQNIYVIDLFQTGGGLGPLKDVLHNPHAETGEGRPLVVMQNVKFDYKWLRHHYGLDLWPLFDTYRASAVLHAGRNREHNLPALYSRELGIDVIVDQMGAAGWDGPLTEAHYTYAAEDVTYLSRLREKLKQKLAQDNLLRTALLEFQAIRPEAEMELNGFALDVDRWMALARSNREKMNEFETVALAHLPHPAGQQGLFGAASWNMRSVPQLKQSLIRLGLPKDLESTDNETLSAYSGVFPAVDALLKWKEYSKRCSSFGEKYEENLHPVDGRIHASYYPYTSAGRYSCSGPNLQQLPRAFEYRDCFRPGPGKKLVAADYSQIELRLVAQASMDPVLLSLYREDKDVHRYTASIVLGIDELQVTKAQRQLAKPINFGLMYGLMPKRLVVHARANYGVNMTLNEARDFWRRYFEAYRGVREWQKWIIEEVKPTHECRTLGGRRRWIDNPNEHNAWMNTPIQGAGADGLKASLWNVSHRLRKYADVAKMVHMVHDEIILEVDDDPDVIREVGAVLQESMIQGMAPILTAAPVVVEPSFGDSWAEAH